MEAARWRRREGLDCRTCPEVRRELGRLPAVCHRCGFPGLWAENVGAWEVVMATGQALVDGMGGIRLENARMVCEALGRRWDRGMIRKVMALAAVMLEKK